MVAQTAPWESNHVQSPLLNHPSAIVCSSLISPNHPCRSSHAVSPAMMSSSKRCEPHFLPPPTQRPSTRSPTSRAIEFGCKRLSWRTFPFSYNRKGSSGKRPLHFEIKNKEAKVRKYKMETSSRGLGHIVLPTDQRKREELRLISPLYNWDIDKALLQRSMEFIHTSGRGLMATIPKNLRMGWI